MVVVMVVVFPRRVGLLTVDADSGVAAAAARPEPPPGAAPPHPAAPAPRRPAARRWVLRWDLLHAAPAAAA